MSEKKQNNLHLTVGPEDSVSFGQATMLGIVRRACDHCFNYWD